MDQRVIFESETLQATATGEGQGRLLFAFDHWRTDRSLPLAPRPDRAFVNRGFTQVRIKTRLNDWFLHPDLPDLLGALSVFSRSYPERVGLGFSMGGYGLLIVSQAVPLHRALFISPHTTPLPDLPKERPFADMRFPGTIADVDFAREAHSVIRATGMSDVQAAVLFDPGQHGDLLHAQEIARHFDRPHMVDIFAAGHPALAGLHPQLSLPLILQSLLGERLDLGPLERAIRRAVRQNTRAAMRRRRGGAQIVKLSPVEAQFAAQ